MKTRKFVDVYYNPDLKNWDEAINKELSRLGLRHGQVTVICRPLKHLKSGTPAVKHYGWIAPVVADDGPAVLLSPNL
jgi:hypothetical protein